MKLLLIMLSLATMVRPGDAAVVPRGTNANGPRGGASGAGGSLLTPRHAQELLKGSSQSHSAPSHNDGAHVNKALEDPQPHEEPHSNFVTNVDGVRKTFSEISPYYLPVTDRYKVRDAQVRANYGRKSRDNHTTSLTKACEKDVNAIYGAISAPSSKHKDVETDKYSSAWAYQLFDSWGKAGDGLLYGNSRWPGSMEECLATTGRSKFSLFTGQYCMVLTERVGSEAPSGILPLSYGTCIPSSCTEAEFKESLAQQLGALQYRPTDVQCQQRGNLWDQKWMIISCSVIGAMVLPVMVATVVQIFRAADKLPKLVKAFSFTENWKKITTIRQRTPGEISCLHGIRVLSISWVMLSHQYFFISDRAENPIKMKMMSQEWTMQMLWSGYKAVDTFFAIGGLLTGIILIKREFCLARPYKPNEGAKTALRPPSVDEKKIKEISSIKKELGENSGNCLQNSEEQRETEGPSYCQQIQSQGVTKTFCIFSTRYIFYLLHRIIRIVPAILVVVMICAGLSEYFVEGAFKKSFQKDYLVECRQDWWVDLTMASNILSAPQGFPYGNNGSDATFRGCIGATWYLGVDFQAYMMAPFLLIPIKMLGKYKWLYSVGVALVFCLISGIVAIAQDLLPAAVMTFDLQAVNDYMRWFYLMPYTRVAPYFVGAFFGLLLVDADAAVKSGNVDGPRWLRILRKKEVLVLGWTIFTATCLAVVFGLVNMNYYSLNNPYPELSGAATFFYASFDSAAWACCVGWIVLTCSFGLAGPIDEFLSHPIWQIPSRVTYSVYLISLPLQGFIFYSGYSFVHLSHLTVMLGYGGVVVLSYLTGTLISFVAEAPYVTLGKLLTGRS